MKVKRFGLRTQADRVASSIRYRYTARNGFIVATGAAGCHLEDLVLANITEFGRTPLFTTQELAGAGVRLVLYPLGAFRAMSQAAVQVYEELRTKGTQAGGIGLMQPREALYGVLGYHACEDKLDALFAREKRKPQGCG